MEIAFQLRFPQIVGCTNSVNIMAGQPQVANICDADRYKIYNNTTSGKHSSYGRVGFVSVIMPSFLYCGARNIWLQMPCFEIAL